MDPPTDLISEISADNGARTTTIPRHRRTGVAAATPTNTSARSSTTRRLAPLAIGAAVMLVATTVASFVRPSDDTTTAAPELNAVISEDRPELDRLAGTTPTPTPAPDPTTTVAPPPPTTAPAPTTEKPVETSAKPKPKPEAQPGPPAPPAAPAPAPRGDGTQAAAAQGWTLVGGDEFNGGRSSQWGDYNGAGHAGKGTRSSNKISVENGAMVIRGDDKGNTGGTAWREPQRFGKWEMRARFPAGDDQYHPVLILWPTDVEWPRGGEVDFAETTSASDKVSFFLHYSASNQQKYAHKNIDITQWHNYAVEWVDGRITGYIDGEKWFESTDPATLPPGKMQATIQLDYFPAGGAPRPTEMHVDYMRIYK